MRLEVKRSVAILFGCVTWLIACSECGTSADCDVGQVCVSGQCEPQGGASGLDAGAQGGGDADADADADAGCGPGSECCSEPDDLVECWHIDAEESGVTCSAGESCAPGQVCSDAGLCTCTNDDDCTVNLPAPGAGVCTGAGICGPSWCDGYYVCSCWGGCDWWSDPPCCGSLAECPAGFNDACEAGSCVKRCSEATAETDCPSGKCVAGECLWSPEGTCAMAGTTCIEGDYPSNPPEVGGCQ